MSNEERIAQFRKLAEENPQDELANFSLGNALLDAGDAKQAAPSFQRVLALNSQNSKAYELLGRAQKLNGDTVLAIQTLKNGYRVAHRKGDIKPLNAMAELLLELGAEPPQIEEKKPETAATETGDGEFKCRRCGGGGPALKSRPFKGELGEKILASVCQNCWNEWVPAGTKVINELRLPLHDPKAQELYDKYMREFLMLD